MPMRGRYLAGEDRVVLGGSACGWRRTFDEDDQVCMVSISFAGSCFAAKAHAGIKMQWRSISQHASIKASFGPTNTCRNGLASNLAVRATIYVQVLHT